MKLARIFFAVLAENVNVGVNNHFEAFDYGVSPNRLEFFLEKAKGARG